MVPALDRPTTSVRDGLKLDLGCGPLKTPGFLGVDRFALPGVDLICDLDLPLPFIDNCADYVIASHSLEHVADLTATMREIYRICRDRGIVTIISPYHATSLNLANPYHKQVFNEHTARFFTEASGAPLLREDEYAFPHASAWGLAGSDFSGPRYDFRPLRHEFFYFEAFRHLADAEKLLLRKSFANVCDQFLIHLLVVKGPIDDPELREFAATRCFHETRTITARRAQELISPKMENLVSAIPATTSTVEQLKKDVAELQGAMSPLDDRIEEVRADAQKQVVELRGDLGVTAAELRELSSLAPVWDASVSRLDHHVQALSARVEEIEKTCRHELQSLHRAVQPLPTSLDRLLAMADAGAARIARLERAVELFRLQMVDSHRAQRANIRSLRHELDAAPSRSELGRLSAHLDQTLDAHRRESAASRERAALELSSLVESKIGSLHRQLDQISALIINSVTANRDGFLLMVERAKRFLRLLTGRGDLATQVAPGFRRLLEAGILKGGVTMRDSLSLSLHLDAGVLLAYELPPIEGGACGVEIALSAANLSPGSNMELHFDVVDETGPRILATGTCSITAAAVSSPVTLSFSLFPTASERRRFLRIAGSHDLGHANVRAYEWHRLKLGPKGFSVERRLFGRVISNHITS